MAEQINNDDVKKMLELLKEHTESAPEEKSEYAAQITKNNSLSDDDIKSMLKKHFSAEDLSENAETVEDYSFDSEDFADEPEETIEEEITEDEPEEIFEEEISADEPEEIVEEEIAADEPEETIEEEIPEDESEEIIEEEIVADEPEEIVEEEITEDEPEEITEEEIPEDEPEEIVEEEITADEPEETIEEEISADEPEEIVEEEITADEPEEIFEEEISADESEEIVEEEIAEDEPEETIEEEITADEPEEIVEEEIAEETVEEELISQAERSFEASADEFKDFDELLAESNFVGSESDEAEIADEEAEQLTILENPEEFTSADEALQAEGEIQPEKSASSEFFNSEEDLDAIDIALMMALGGEDELNKTMGFEKIRQAVNDYDEGKESGITQSEIYGSLGEEYTKKEQNGDIKDRYDKQKSKITYQLLGTLFFALALLIYEIAGWAGAELPGIFNKSEHPVIYILAGLQLLFLCAAFSYKKIAKCIKGSVDVSSATCFSAVALTVINIINDICIIAFSLDAPMIYHSASALLFVISIFYDMFSVCRERGAFDVISQDGTKFVLEPYGRIKINDKEADTDDSVMVMDKDSYFASKTSFVDRYFARTGEAQPQSVSKATSLILSLVLAFVVMLVLILLDNSFESVLSGFVFTISFSLIATTVLESEYAFFVAYKKLKRIRSCIIGKASAFEYGNCDLIYFDDVDVFDKKSVKTKGLKLYDNNEIYRVLYNTQAVFSKIGGPLRAVFEYATTEMAHSRNVVIKDITGEGISALVDSKTLTLIGSGAFMKSQGLSPKYTDSDLKCEEAGDESIMFIALNGVICAKLYVTYKFSRHFELMMKKLNSKGVNIGIRSADPNVNLSWANKLSKYKKSQISIAKPTLKELNPSKRSADSGVASALSSKAAIEALIMCLRLCEFEKIISKLRIFSVVAGTALALVLLLFAGVNAVSLLVMALYSAACVSTTVLLSYLYTKR